MSNLTNAEPKKNTMQWFDLSSKGIYITPEMICGKPCVLLLDSPLIFSGAVTRKIKLEELGFEPIQFESRDETKQFLYVKFTESIDSDFLINAFEIPAESIRIIENSLLDIQTIFYKLASECYSFRVDVLIKSSLLLGANHQGSKVYSSMFGRYKISQTGFNKSESIFSLEAPHERNLSYLRATTAQDVLSCCQGFIVDALEKRRNISLSDAMRFASILFQEKNTKLDPTDVQPQQILMLLNAFNLIYIKNMVPGSSSEIKDNSYFADRNNFKNICLSSEACPSPPRAIYTNFMANQYSTPSPLSFIMQKLLIGDVGADLNASVLDPMFGFGSLTNILSVKGMPIQGIEKNTKKVEMVGFVDFENTRIQVADCLSSNLLDFSKDGKPFKYVICNPACYINPTTYEYTGNNTSIRVNRSDFIILLKSLAARMDGGRSVFLLPYFNEDVGAISKDQDLKITELLDFINARFCIEGVSLISSEIYSKSLRKINPLLIVIGDKRDNYEKTPHDFLGDALKHPVLNYESLWDWANLICYKRSPLFDVDQEQYEKASDVVAETVYEEAVESSVDESSSEFSFTGNSLVSPKKTQVKLADSNSLFSSPLVNPGLEIPEEDKPKEDTPAEDKPKEDTPAEDKPKEDTPAEDESDTYSGRGLPITADSVTDENEFNPPVNNPGDLTDKKESTPDVLNEVPASTEEVSSQHKNEEPKPIFKKDRIVGGKGNLFSLNEVNKVIRYHSAATLSEPTANVHQSDFSAYLCAKKNLSDLLSRSFDGITDPTYSLSFNQLNNYKTAHNLPICIEAFVGAKLGLPHPSEWCSFFKSEHLDLIAAAIFKFHQNRSLMVLDSIGLKPEIAVAALLEFNRDNKQPSFIIIKNPRYLEKIVFEYKKYHHALFADRPELKFISLNDVEEPEKHLAEFSIENVFVIHSDSMQKPLNIPLKAIHDLYINTSIVFHETDFGSVKQINPLFNMLHKRPNFYISPKFIGPETNIKTIPNLFSPNVISRYFSNGLTELDDMSSHLLKMKMIEDLSVFQRFEDLSFIDLVKTEDIDNWSSRFSILAKSYSSAINNIVLLAEEIYKNSPSHNSYLLPKLRSVAIQIYELCTLCITSIPLTHSIFKAVRNQSKPIVVLPKNIENILFLLLESLSVELVKDEIDNVYVTNLSELNQYIEQKKRLIEADGGLSNISDAHFENIRDLEAHIMVRNKSVFEYLTCFKQGSESKIPDLTSLIAAFYRNTTLDLREDLANYDDLKLKARKVEDEINALMDLPLLITDFIKYELAQHQISSGEITDRTFSINYELNNWSVSKKSPYFTLINSENSKFDIANSFNAGNLDILFIEADAVDGLQLSSIRDNSSIVSDHNRKRVLILTYLNMPIQHYLPLIHLVSDPEQFSPPEVHCELLLTPVQKILYQLFVQQLELFNVQSVAPVNNHNYISYYLSDVGQKLIAEYLSVNPSYLAYKPNTPVQFWTIYDLLNIVNMTNVGLESNILDHLNYFARQHLDYLKDTKANPFDIFTVSPKAKIHHGDLDKDALYLNQLLKSDVDGGFFGGIKQSTLSYVKNTSEQLTLEKCCEIHVSQKSIELSVIKTILKNQFRDEVLSKDNKATHADWLAQYIDNYTHYLISTFRDKVVGKLQDRYQKWIFSSGRVSDKAYIESHFRGVNSLKIASDLDDLYFEILMLADMELIESFEGACKVLTFLKSYHLTITKQGENESPILIPIPSPFNDRQNQILEGFLIRIDFPPSVMISLTAKAFSLSIAYPSKSKPIELNLAYVLEHHRVLDGQSVLSAISEDKQKAILKAYKSSGFKDLISQKIRDFQPAKISGFTDLTALNQSEHHPTILAFRKKTPPHKVRYMYVVHGNLFDSYYFLRRLIPLTMVSFTNENGLAVPGFVISPNMSKEDLSLHLIRATPLQNVLKVLKFAEQQNNRKYLRSIQWHGDVGVLEAGYLDRDTVELNFIGKQSQLQKVFSSKQIFKEYPFIENAVDVVNMMDLNTPSHATPTQSPSNKGGSKKTSLNGSLDFSDDLYGDVTANTQQSSSQAIPFEPLSFNGVECTQKGDDLSYRFKIPYKQLSSLVSIIEKDRIYSISLIDFNEVAKRSNLRNLVQKNGV